MSGAVWSKQWFDFLIETGNAALVEGHGKMADDDREGLETAIKDLWEAFALQSAGGEVGAFAVGRMMSASFLIGCYATVTTSHKKQLLDGPNQTNAKLPRSPYHRPIEVILKDHGGAMRTKEIANILGVECDRAFENLVSRIRKQLKFTLAR